GNRLGCCYDCREAETGKFLITLTFDLTLEAGLGGLSVNPFLSVGLKPFGPVQEGYLILLLQSRDGATGRFFNVSVAPTAPGGASIRFGKRDDVLEVIKVLGC